MSLPPSNKNTDVFPNRTATTPLAPAISSNTVDTGRPILTTLAKKEAPIPQDNNLILYDSKAAKEFNKSLEEQSKKITDIEAATEKLKIANDVLAKEYLQQEFNNLSNDFEELEINYNSLLLEKSKTKKPFWEF